MGIAYRPEIDGLRAIAVLAVVLYHAGIGGAGFIGVDVFFVISGYLVTSLLLCEQRDSGRIDFLAFYARRVRRLFPAAAVVVLAAVAAGRPLLAPDQQAHLDKSAGAALAFGANVFFQLTSGGYFDGRAEEMPLLHLWSLSVEEQFYFLWPALLMLVPRRWLGPALAGLGLASLALAEVWIGQGSDAAFYEMPARFWELAAGGLIAATPARALPGWLAPAGIVLTLAACTVPLAHFPGVGALPAVLGACAIVATVHGGGRSVLLASRPMVGIGLISYSLYLWHWPLLAFYRATSIGDGSVAMRLELCAAAFVLAVASYRYVEQPFRRLRARSGQTVIAGAALSSVLALSACAVGLNIQSTRTPADRAELDRPVGDCHASSGDVLLGNTPPIKCWPHTRTLVWGDSMAWAWLPAVPNGADLTMDACPPFLDSPRYNPKPADKQCRNHNATVVTLPADVVVIAGRWASYGDLAPLAPTLDALAHVPRVVIVGPTPEMRDLVPRCIRQHAEAACAVPRAEFDARARPVLAQLRALAAKHPNTIVLDETDHFCTATTCPPVLNGVALYWDTHHITASAAKGVQLLR